MDLPDDDKGVLNEMLRYLYTADYQEEHTAEKPCFTPLLLSVHIHTIADKYNIPALAELAEAKFAKRAVNEWKTEDFANSVEEMYATASDSKTVLHACAVRTAVHNAKQLYGEDFGKQFRDVTSKTPEFTSEFATMLVNGGKAKKLDSDETRYKCISCHETWTARAPPNTSRGLSKCLQCGCGSYGQFWSVVS